MRTSWPNTLQSKVGLAWAQTNRIADTAIRYANCFGAVRGPLLYASSAVRQSSGGRLAETTVPGTDVKLLLRPGTSDVSVFNGIYCWREYEWQFQNPPRVIVDAGAYTGLSSAYFAVRYPDAQIIAIEPGDSNFELLLRNTASFKNVHPVHAALWTHTGLITLTDPGYGAWGLQVREHPPGDTGTASIFSHPARAITVADVIRDYGLDRIDVLKLDIEGSEKEIFEDCGPWIDRVDAICMELHDRFKAGCSRSFFNAVEEFPVEQWRGENVLVSRSGPPLTAREEAS